MSEPTKSRPRKELGGESETVKAIKEAYRFANSRDRKELKKWMHLVLAGINRTTATGN